MRIVRSHRPPEIRTCAGCGNVISVLACRADKVQTSYCNGACKKAHHQEIRQRPLTHERLLEVLAYDPDTGVFTWRKSPKHRAGEIKPGDVAGTLRNGYVRILLDRTLYSAHRLAWFYVHREWPPDQMDHRDKVRSHNAIGNLRPATGAQNQRNVDAKRTSKTGVKGVNLNRGKFVARINRDGIRRYLGHFDNLDDAQAAYAVAASEIDGAFLRVAATERVGQ
jgi:hypothetical protein